MAALNYICIRRNDIPNGTLQVLDLWPNESQRNGIYDPRGQTKYLRKADVSPARTIVGGGGAILAATDLSGVAAYLIDHVEAGGLGAGTAAFTAGEANTAAAAVAALVTAGTPVTLANVNTALSTVVATTELTSAGGSASTGSLEALIKVLSGAEYIVPAGSVLDTDGSTFNPVVSGMFNNATYLETVQSGAFEISIRRGHLAGMLSPKFNYNGIVGAAIVIFDNAGNLLP